MKNTHHFCYYCQAKTINYYHISLADNYSFHIIKITGLKMATECRQCNPSQYCNGFGLIEPTGDCQAGIPSVYFKRKK